jgi:hypothetical protein
MQRRASLPDENGIQILSPHLATSIVRVNGETHVFSGQFLGPKVGGKNPVQTLEPLTITVAAGHGTSAEFLPFLDAVPDLNGPAKQGQIVFTLPVIAKGAIFWLANE